MLRPGPRWDLVTLPQTPSRLGRGHPSPYLTLLGAAFGASILPPSALAIRRFRRLGLGGLAPPPNIFPLEPRLFATLRITEPRQRSPRSS